MARPALRHLALATTATVPMLLGPGAVSAVEINQTLYGEVLIEGISQNNYTDANGESYVRVDPAVYNNLNTITTIANQQFLGGLLIDPNTYRLMVLNADKSTYYNDSSSLMWMRAKLGAKIEMEDTVEANISLVFDAEGGDRSHFGQPGNINGGIYLGEANILLKRFILDELHLRAGRQSVSWNLRRGHGAFLHDSRANNPIVTSWDGVRAFYTFENFTFSPYHFILDAAREQRGLNIVGNGLTSGVASSKDNTLSGLHIDWQPEALADARFFVTGAVSLERNVVIHDGNALTGVEPLVGKRLFNYYGGIEAELPAGLTLFVEGAFQDGDLDQYRSFRGHGVSAGFDWNVGGLNNAVIGLKFDHSTGDRRATNGFMSQALDSNSLIGRALNLSTVDKILISNVFENDPNDRHYNNFVASWEGVSDALIVEHERYGELSELVVGNMAAIKAKAEYRFDHLDAKRPFHLKFLYGHFILDRTDFDSVTGEANANYFGSEFDLHVTWQYSKFTTISMFGGIFLPGLGYRQVAAQAYPNSVWKPSEVRDYQYIDQAINGAPGPLSFYYDALYPRLTARDPITLFGVNLHVTF